MLVDFKNTRRTNGERLPELPYCRASELLANEQRSCTDFNAVLAGQLESDAPMNNSSERSNRQLSPLEILSQLL